MLVTPDFTVLTFSSSYGDRRALVPNKSQGTCNAQLRMLHKDMVITEGSDVKSNAAEQVGSILF